MANDEVINMREPDYTPATFYEIVVKDKDGKQVSMNKYRDKVLLIVNVATMSACASSMYKELNDLHVKYVDEGLEILAFPCNQFAAQEPLRTEYLQEAVSSRFKPHFPLFEKVDVNGPNTAVLFRYLKDKSDGDRIRWNFTKFLINRTGGIAGRYAPHVPVYKLEEDIKGLLAVELPFEKEKNEAEEP